MHPSPQIFQLAIIHQKNYVREQGLGKATPGYFFLIKGKLLRRSRILENSFQQHEF